ncbi:MAG TPA: UDP-N-acetylmuramate dehydrogenase [Solirubrobacterales bacterium]
MTDLAAHTTIGLGGPAKEFAEARTELDLLSLLDDAEQGELFVLGGGSNILVADDGVGGRTLKVITRGIERVHTDQDREVLRVQAGESWDRLVTETVDNDLAGIECLAGIPGTVGATPIQNVGAYGQEVAEVVVKVEAFDRHLRRVVELTREECQFDYRTSVFKKTPGRYVVIAIQVKLERSALSKPIRNKELAARLGVARRDRVDLNEAREAVLALRKKKGMVLDREDPDTYSLGSFFTNPRFGLEELQALEARALEATGETPPTFAERSGADRVRVPAAWMIERAGFDKGHGGDRGIGISGKHVLALVNRGGGTTAEVLELAQTIVSRVWDVFGVALSPEPTFIGHAWTAPTLE